MTEVARRTCPRRNWRALMPEILDYVSMGYERDQIASIMEVPRTTMDYQIAKVIPNAKGAAREAKRIIRSKRYLGVPTSHVLNVDKTMTKDQLAAMRAAIPKDTRDNTAIFCGDPLPGRSALDQASAEEEADFEISDISIGITLAPGHDQRAEF